MILVTGATGFVGRRVVRELVRRGHRVRALVHTRARAGMIADAAVEVAYGDVRDPGSLEGAVEGVEAVVHLVAVIRERGSSTFPAVNHLGTRNVVQAASRAGAKRMVHLSVIGSADVPRFSYLRSKWLGEQEVVQGRVPSLIIRSSILFGEGDEFINTLAALVRAFPLVPVAGRGEPLFQPLMVEDLARCIAQALEDGSLLGRVVEVGGTERFTYNQLIDVIAAALGRRRPKLHIPLALMRWLVKAMELALPHPPVTGRQLEMLTMDNVAEMDSVERAFGFTPRPLGESLEYIRSMSYGEAIRISFGFASSRRRER